MRIHGKERKFLFGIGSFGVVAELCEDNDVTKIGKLLGGNDLQQLRVFSRLALSMNHDYEYSRIYEEDRNYTPDCLTEQELRTLRPSRLPALKAEIMEAIDAGLSREVETEENREKKQEPGDSGSR